MNQKAKLRFPIVAALLVYASAAVLANLTVYWFGPPVTPINAFFLIGLDLVLRDWLQLRISKTQILFVILGASVISFALAPGARTIAAASAAAFLVSGLADWAVFSATRGSFLRRSGISNLVGAAVDSIIFPLLAFGTVFPAVMILQFVCKAFGGLCWAYLLSRFVTTDASHSASRPS